MTKEEFIQRVLAAVQDSRLEELDELYDEIVLSKNNYPPVETSGGGGATIVWTYK